MTTSLAHEAKHLTADAFFKEMISTTTKETRRETLIAIKNACDKLEAEGKSIGPTSVSNKLLEQKTLQKPPSVQYLKNKSTNGGISDYIFLREIERPKSKDIDSLNKNLSLNPQEVSLQLQGAKANIKLLESQLARALKLIDTKSQSSANIEDFLHGSRPISHQSRIEIPPQILQALNTVTLNLTDKFKLGKCGLETFDDGRVTTNDGIMNELIPPGVIGLLLELKSILSKNQIEHISLFEKNLK